MTRYADPLVCPDCRGAIEYGVPTCPHCALPLRGATAQALFATLLRADQLIDQLRIPAPVFAAPAAPVPTWAPVPQRSRLDAASIPRILLGLGATCLLVAALVFLVVAWSSLGMGGRTAVLLTLTSAAGATTVWLNRKALRAGAESFAVVMLGLLALDVAGADNAGWFGAHDAGVFATILGGTVAVAGLATAAFGLRSPVGRLVGAELVAVLAAGILGVGVTDLLPEAAGILVALVVSAAAAGVARWVRLGDVGTGLLGLAGLWWLGLVAVGLDDVLAEPTADRIWGELLVWPLLAAALIAALPALVRVLPPSVRVAAAGTAATVLSAAATVVVVGNPLSQIAETGVAVLALAALAVALLPSPWRGASLGPLVPAAVLTVFFAVLQAGYVAGRFELGVWTVSPAHHLLDRALPIAPWLLPPLVGSLAGATFVGARLLEERLRWSIVLSIVVPMTAAGTLASYDVPLWAPFAVLIVGTLATYAAEFLGGPSLQLGTVAVGAVALAAGAPSQWLTLVALVTLAGIAVVIDQVEDDAVGAQLAMPVLVGATVATTADLATWPGDWRTVSVIAVVGLLALWRPRPGIELAAGVTGFAAVAVQAPGLTWLAIDLTVAGAMVTISSLVHQRRDLGWAAGALLTAATWVRLADLEVTTVEAYTLPLAVALVLVGLWRMWRSEAPSMQALSPGLVLATTPTLLQVLADPVSDRAVLLGAGCLVLVLAGVWLRWSGPFLVGATIGGLEVVRNATYASVLPQWVLIALAGGLLTAIGVTWEERLRDLRLAAGYVRGLR